VYSVSQKQNQLCESAKYNWVYQPAMVLASPDGFSTILFSQLSGTAGPARIYGPLSELPFFHTVNFTVLPQPEAM
jgi:hypothetical protein